MDEAEILDFIRGQSAPGSDALDSHLLAFSAEEARVRGVVVKRG